jgi:hypothetical protein
MRLLLRVLPASVLVLMAASCVGPPPRWTLTVYNNDSQDSAVVRINTPTGPADWLLRPQQIDTLIDEEHPIEGSIEILDPMTCERLAREEFSRERRLLILLDQGMSGDGPWQIHINAMDPEEGEGISPDFFGCEGR